MASSITITTTTTANDALQPQLLSRELVCLMVIFFVLIFMFISYSFYTGIPNVYSAAGKLGNARSCYWCCRYRCRFVMMMSCCCVALYTLMWKEYCLCRNRTPLNYTSIISRFLVDLAETDTDFPKTQPDDFCSFTRNVNVSFLPETKKLGFYAYLPIPHFPSDADNAHSLFLLALTFPQTKSLLTQ